MLTLAGFDRAGERASAVLTLGNGDRAKPGHARGVGKRSQCRQRVDACRLRAAGAGDGLDRLLRRGGLARQRELVAWQPSAVTGVAALVASQPLEAWKDYLRVHAIHDFADVLPRAFAEQALALHAAAGGRATAVPRRARARCHASRP